ncbi:MAG: hypothetical protein JWO99_366 [Candidatus Saccharibacteria bacterium]|nr:hypothetical protein [Candidatus Saccharibacteria bacterium]
MAKMDTPDEPSPHFNVSDINSFASEKGKLDRHEVDTDDLNDVDFAHYRLAVWSHPANLSRVVEVIIRDLIDDTDRQAPSIDRLRALIADPRYDSAPVRQDPYDANFADALQYASTDEQAFAINAVHRLHTVTLSSELAYSGVDSHIRLLVEAILKTKS